MTDTDWPRDWTPRERVETVALDRDSPDDPAGIADKAGVNVETARDVLAEMAEDYTDARWSNSTLTVDND